MAKPATVSFQLAQAPGHLLRRAQQRAVEIFAQELGPGGPTPQQFALLLSIAQQPGISQVGLVRAIGVDRSTVAEMVQRLARRGLIARRRTAQDGRENTLTLSAAGTKLLQRALPAVERAQHRIMAPLARAQRKVALRLLTLLAGL
jgi:DNA-binding MarR family transcriptional regulator